MTPRSRARLAGILVFCAISGVAFANGSMGLALEMFDIRTWSIYVLAMVGLEAWLIGEKGGYDWQRSLLISAFANGTTAFFCTGMIGVALHSFGYNPDPLLYVTEMLFWFGLGSAYIESIVWSFWKPNVQLPPTEHRFGRIYRKSLVLRSFLAHMAGVPVALVILLSPSHPYEGLSSLVHYQRRMAMDRVMKSFGESLAGKDMVPAIGSMDQIVSTYAPDYVKSREGAWAIAYVPEYTRFDRSEQRRHPWQWNPAVSGATLTTDGNDKTDRGEIWLCRVSWNDYTEGYVLDRNTGLVSRTSDPEKLGYGGKPTRPYAGG